MQLPRAPGLLGLRHEADPWNDVAAQGGPWDLWCTSRPLPMSVSPRQAARDMGTVCG